MKRKLLMVLWIALLGIGRTNAQSRGTTPGELYIAMDWYEPYWAENPNYFTMIIHTDDYGKTFTQKYVYQQESDGMPIERIYADATPEALYSQIQYTDDMELHGFYRSFDDGENWEKIETPGLPGLYVTGSIPGEIYKFLGSYEGYVWFSNDYGENFTITGENVKFRIETGIASGEAYGRGINDSGEYTIHYSYNYFTTYDTTLIEPSIGGYNVSGHFPTISRGVISGELYLTSWWLPANYKIYRSTDHGQNFTLQYEQPDTCYFWDESFGFTAGRGEGEFYIMKTKFWIEGYYHRLHVYHSDDYAQSFKEYVHIFDENWTENTRSIYAISHPESWGTVSGVANYTLGETATLTATPHTGYEFKEWTEHGETVSDNPVYSFEVTETRNLVANFQLVNTISTPQSTVEINIYPNPATGHATLSIPNVSSFKNSTIHIINLYGQTVKVIPIKEKQTQIDLTDLPAGSYLYLFTDGSYQLKTGKIIIH